MHHDVVDCGPLSRVVVEYLRDQVACVVADRNVLGEGVRIHADALVSRLNIRGFEGGLANDERVNYDTDGPNIDFIGVTLLALEDFWSDIVRRTANGALALAVELKLGSETEVANLDLHLVVKEEVAKLEISMNYPVAVEVLDSRADLVDVTLHFELVEALAATQKLVQGLVLAQLEKNIDILGVFEEVLEPDDVVLVEGAVDLDLRHKLLFGTGLRQSGLGDNLGRRNSLVLEISELEAAGETSLAEELALQVLLDADFAVVLYDFLFDDSLSSVDTFFGVPLLHWVYFLYC
mmetsp:Transcript_24716/g.30853  ORF Transcript_24716/g.30853 Transcript_24716/m.30853 type:complete len:293 (-) Transcript_24716:24-902(-)